MSNTLEAAFTPSRTPSYQFIHISTAAAVRVAKPQGRTYFRNHHGTFRAVGWSAKDLLNEALRVAGECPHIELPQEKPIIVYAATEQLKHDPTSVVHVAHAWADSRKEITKRKHQKNSPVLASGVVSLKRDSEEDWPLFRSKSVEYLQEKYGDRLRLVLEHEDEENPHIHFFLVPLHGIDKDGKPFSEDFGTVHQGLGAKKETYEEYRKANGKTATNKEGRAYVKGAKTRAAFFGAMKEFQDEFHEKVAKHFGLSRIGPKLERLSHSEARRKNAIRQAEADAIEADSLKQKAIAAEKAAAAYLMERARIAQEIEEEAQIEAEQIMHKAEEQANEILRKAETEAKEQKRIIDALIAGDERVVLRIFKENVELKKEKADLQGKAERKEKQLIVFENAVVKLVADLDSAKAWLKRLIGYLEEKNDFTFSHIFLSQKPAEKSDACRIGTAGEGARERKNSGVFKAPAPKPKPSKSKE
jgi:hypothetical protein